MHSDMPYLGESFSTSDPLAGVARYRGRPIALAPMCGGTIFETLTRPSESSLPLAALDERKLASPFPFVSYAPTEAEWAALAGETYLLEARRIEALAPTPATASLYRFVQRAAARALGDRVWLGLPRPEIPPASRASLDRDLSASLLTWLDEAAACDRFGAEKQGAAFLAAAALSACQPEGARARRHQDLRERLSPEFSAVVGEEAWELSRRSALGVLERDLDSLALELDRALDALLSRHAEGTQTRDLLTAAEEERPLTAARVEDGSGIGPSDLGESPLRRIGIASVAQGSPPGGPGLAASREEPASAAEMANEGLPPAAVPERTTRGPVHDRPREPTAESEQVVLEMLREARGGYVSAHRISAALVNARFAGTGATGIIKRLRAARHRIETAPHSSEDQGWRLLETEVLVATQVIAPERSSST